MKCIFAVVFVLLGVAAAARLPRNTTKYTTKYDNIDLDEILKSERLLNNYFNCLMERGKCTPDGSELKRHLPDALETGCSKCSEKQKNGTDKVVRYLMEHRKDQFNELEQKYDPTGIYRKKYEAELAASTTTTAKPEAS